MKLLQDDDSSHLSVGAQCEASHHLKNNNLFTSTTSITKTKMLITEQKVFDFIKSVNICWFCLFKNRILFFVFDQS